MKTFLFAFIITIFLSACSSLSVRTDYDETIDFSHFTTYRWHVDNEHNANSLKYVDQIMDKRIRATIDQQLSTQQFTRSNAEPVDFLVNYSVVVEDRTDVRTYNNYNGMYPGYSYRAGYGYYGGMGMGYSTGSETQVTHYKQGTLIIDIINPETDQLMWRGAADGRLPKGATREKSDALIQEYVAKILSSFPPKIKQ